jgi:tRNA-splicing ligase RtcB
MSQGQGRSSSGLRYFQSPTAEVDLATDRRLKAVASLPYVRNPVVALADLHWKDNLETPSSTATATRNEIVLSFSSPSQNCGMTLLKTPFHLEEFKNQAGLVKLMESIRDSIPRSRKQPILTRNEAIKLAAGGAREAARQFGIDPSMLSGIELNGSLFPDGEADASTVLDALDETCLEKGRYSFAFIGGGNHFLELQVVDEILEPAACEAMGLERGQLVIMYHTGSERLGHDLGRLYGVRLKTSPRRKRKYFFRKIPLHLLRRFSAPGQIRKRWGYHFAKDEYIPVPADSEEGRRLQTSLKIAGNYGYANRVAVLDLILKGFQVALGKRSRDFHVISDLSHNVISREEIGGEKLWVHRHNSVRLRPPSDWPEDSTYRKIGQPAMLPGTNRSSSYIIVSREGASSSLNSADHGAGRTVDRFLKEGRSSERPDRKTLKFTYASPSPEEVTHLTDEGIDEVVETLGRSEIAAAAAKLRPLAVLKG